MAGHEEFMFHLQFAAIISTIYTCQPIIGEQLQVKRGMGNYHNRFPVDLTHAHCNINIISRSTHDPCCAYSGAATIRSAAFIQGNMVYVTVYKKMGQLNISRLGCNILSHKNMYLFIRN